MSLNELKGFVSMEVGTRFRLLYLGRMVVSVLGLLALPLSLQGQIDLENLEKQEELPTEVAVEQITPDQKISQRLQHILEVSDWFTEPKVKSNEGVVFLEGEADSQKRKDWATELASKVEGVAAVINHMTITQPSIWTLKPVLEDVQQFVSGLIRLTPLLLLSLALLSGAWMVATHTTKFLKWLMMDRVPNPLIRSVLAQAFALTILLLGLSFVFRLFGMTNLAVTLLGSTGLIGLALGLAFRDIAENFFASLLLSIQRPFRREDFISVAGHEGYVLGVNTRSTVLMTKDGNHIQVPNATVYKEIIVNQTANPNIRLSFQAGIGYEDSITQAQKTILAVLEAHEAVLDEPKPLILVEELGSATVDLMVTFWVNARARNHQTVRSAIMRQVKTALSRNGISMPDPARERIFPESVSVALQKEPVAKMEEATASKKNLESDADGLSSGEGSQDTESKDILAQARGSELPEQGQDLLM